MPSEVRVSSLSMGDSFVTCLTGREGMLIRPVPGDLGIRVILDIALAGSGEEKVLHPNVLVRA